MLNFQSQPSSFAKEEGKETFHMLILYWCKTDLNLLMIKYEYVNKCYEFTTIGINFGKK